MPSDAASSAKHADMKQRVTRVAVARTCDVSIVTVRALLSLVSHLDEIAIRASLENHVQLNQLKPQLAPDQHCGTLQRFDGYVAPRLEDTINLRTTGVHQLSQPRLAHALPLHFLAELPRNHPGDGFDLRCFPDAFFIKELIQGGAPMWIHLRLCLDLGLAHASISFIRLCARAISAGGIFCVFLMKSCTTPNRPFPAKNNRRAILLSDRLPR